MSRGRPLNPDKSPAHRGTYILPTQLAVELKALAKKLDRSDTWIIRKALEAYLKAEVAK